MFARAGFPPFAVHLSQIREIELRLALPLPPVRRRWSALEAHCGAACMSTRAVFPHGRRCHRQHRPFLVQPGSGDQQDSGWDPVSPETARIAPTTTSPSTWRTPPAAPGTQGIESRSGSCGVSKAVPSCCCIVVIEAVKATPRMPQTPAPRGEDHHLPRATRSPARPPCAQGAPAGAPCSTRVLSAQGLQGAAHPRTVANHPVKGQLIGLRAISVRPLGKSSLSSRLPARTSSRGLFHHRRTPRRGPPRAGRRCQKTSLPGLFGQPGTSARRNKCSPHTVPPLQRPR